MRKKTFFIFIFLFKFFFTRLNLFYLENMLLNWRVFLIELVFWQTFMICGIRTASLNWILTWENVSVSGINLLQGLLLEKIRRLIIFQFDSALVLYIPSTHPQVFFEMKSWLKPKEKNLRNIRNLLQPIHCSMLYDWNA